MRQNSVSVFQITSGDWRSSVLARVRCSTLICVRISVAFNAQQHKQFKHPRICLRHLYLFRKASLVKFQPFFSFERALNQLVPVFR